MEFLNNKFVLSTLLVVVGIALKTFFDKVLNKTKKIYYTVNSERVALSANDPIFGDIKIEWQGSPVNNLYNTVIEIENTTSVDYKNIELEVYSGNDVLILNERTSTEGSPNIIYWSESFKEKMMIPNGEQATVQQIDNYHHQRVYNVPVFNRGQKLQFIYLSTIPNNNNHNGIWLSVVHPGLKVDITVKTQEIHGVPITKSLPIGLTALVGIIALSIIYIDSIWGVAIVCAISGAIAQTIGAYIYKVYDLIRNLIIK